MPTASDPYTIYDQGWILRLQPPRDLSTGSRVLLLLHGWKGDETVMWIFARGAPPGTWIYAPRAPVQAPDGGYGWLPHTGQLPEMPDFTGVASQLMSAYFRWAAEARIAHLPFDVMGFSQGAAMAYAVAANYPEKVRRVIALAGFLPVDRSTNAYSAFHGLDVFIAHGTQDTTVPVTLAKDAASRLEDAGAHVTYCEGDTGHKLSAACLRRLDTFLNAR